ncbi:hypothetical protein ACA910_009756 [Epithemia clementina (nom. ined.)]
MSMRVSSTSVSLDRRRPLFPEPEISSLNNWKERHQKGEGTADDGRPRRGGGSGGQPPTLTLVGRSRAGDGTSFAIPQLHWLFDCGALVGEQPTHIFLTHTHSDHITFLTRFAAQMTNNAKQRPPTIYLPPAALPFVEAFLNAHQALVDLSSFPPPTVVDAAAATSSDDEEIDQKSNHSNSQLSYYKFLCPVAPGQEFKLHRRGGDEYAVIPIEADHRIVCNGYSIFRIRKRLKDEYRALPGHEIGRLRKQGVTGLYEEYREPVLCYIGDTTHRVFERHSEILQQHYVIVTECTFIGDNQKDMDRAEETKHSHWKFLKPIVQAHPQTFFVLIHFSLKYSNLTLIEFFNQEMEQAQCFNVHPMLLSQEIADEWSKQQQKQQTSPSPPPTCRCFQCQP